MKRAVVVDYGMGNLRSISHALDRLGASCMISDDPRVIEAADRLVIPGQGAFGTAMERLRERQLIEPMQKRVHDGRPVLGVCLGLQLFYELSAEAPGVAGLGLLPGQVDILPDRPGRKRPHMGWTPVEHASDHPVLKANESGEAFYFVHSYAATEAPGYEVATAEHGVRFIAALAKSTVVAAQFHPEKSQEAGARLLTAWLAL